MDETTGFRDRALRRFLRLVAFPQPPLVPIRHPVVLMHGFGLLAGLRREGHLHHEALFLRLHGVKAYAPNVASYNTVPVRATMWRRRIERILEETGADKVVLIAHSMGGLDARYLISRMGLHEVVPILVTVSTPHHGSAVADYILRKPASIRKLLALLLNWMGTNALDDATSDFLKAVETLCPDYTRDTFNPATPNHPSVEYWSYAGCAGRGTGISINPLMRPFHNVLVKCEGLNDGLVSVESAKWGTFKGSFEADHPQQVGIQGLPGRRFDSNAFYLSIVRELAAAGY